MDFSIKDLFSKCDQIRRFMWIRSHLLKKSSAENAIFCAMICVRKTFCRQNPLSLALPDNLLKGSYLLAE